jgi:hypothetical protein
MSRIILIFVSTLKTNTMNITATKQMKLEVIGDIAFVFNSKSRRKGKRILVSNCTVHDRSLLKLDDATCKMLNKEMRAKGSDLLTDGHRFYTLVSDNGIVQISHKQFNLELELHNELYK